MAATPLLREVSPVAVRALAELGTVRRYRAQTYLFHEGDGSDAIFFLLEGRIEVGTVAGTGHRRLLATMDTPQFFGELGVLGGRGRTVTALALEDSTVWGADAERFIGFLEHHFEATSALLQRMAEQIQDHEAFMAALIHLDLKGRVAKRLLRTASADAEVLPTDGAEIVAATHADLAAMCGGSRENVTRVLSEFQRRGLVERDGRRLILKRVDTLARLAGL
jgi:CRP/FNR family transcriptional regulator, cyclic AMP receptor protein